MEEYQITQGEIIAKWQEIIQQPDTYGEGVISAVRLARWVERRLQEKATNDDPDAGSYGEYQHVKAQQRT